jgi:multiple sugar transport system ATP-binding protein
MTAVPPSGGAHPLYNGSSGTFLPVKESYNHGNCPLQGRHPALPGQPQADVDKLNIDIADGEFLVFVGPSGCGKSTSLRMLAGLEEVNGGQIFIGDRDVTTCPPRTATSPWSSRTTRSTRTCRSPTTWASP